MMICPKCIGNMEEGFVLDRSDDGLRQSDWIEGPPEKSFWLGVKTKGRERLPIATWRCERCGFLESYTKGASPTR